MNIVCDDGPDKAWCDQYGCGGELQELKDGTMICLACDYAYLPNSVTKHKRNLQPIESQYDTDGPILVSMNEYGQPQRKKPTILDKEDKIWLAQGKGRSIIDVEDYWPEGEPK